MATFTVTSGLSPAFVSGDTVTPAKLNSLGTPTIAISAIQTADISDAQITADKLATGAVTGAAGGGKLAASAITSQTQLADALASGDEFLVHDASASALRRVAWSAMQAPGTVVGTDYAELVGEQTYTGNTIATNVTSPTTSSGHELVSRAYAMSSASNYLIISGSFQLDSSTGNESYVLLLFAGSTLIASRHAVLDRRPPLSFIIKHSPGSTASVTYSIRAGVSSANLFVNKNSVTIYNTGKNISSMLIQEIKG